MLLWVLEYEISEDKKIFLSPNNGHSMHLKDALKFESELSALQFLHDNNPLFSFKPAAYSFEFAD